MLAKYEGIFDKLQRFAPSLVDIEEKTIKKFYVRLRHEVVRVVASQHNGTFSVL